MASEEVVKLCAYDGQIVWIENSTALYEVGNFLGGGAAGTVYECEHSKSQERFALKILNPIGFKILSPALVKRCTVVCKGKTFTDAQERMKSALSLENVYWLINGTSKQYLCAYFSERFGGLKELTLTQCVQVWGADPSAVGESDGGDEDSMSEVAQIPNGPRVLVPTVPPKYAEFVRSRRRIFREIKNMRKISNHVNVIRLESVLELVQESKCTIFLVMELANGGELFDRIKLDCGAREDTAKVFFKQLLIGVKHCHEQGVCHRDLKPENLLLQDLGDLQSTILKIADFGFSARFAMGSGSTRISLDAPHLEVYSNLTSNAPVQSNVSSSSSESFRLRMLKSVVGSPFYVAPEVLMARGYDGPKADVWSLGVILYAMLAGNLPFDQELITCKRYKMFCKWIQDHPLLDFCDCDELDDDLLSWLFPSKFSRHARSLIISMLHPDPEKRISVADAMQHVLLADLMTSVIVSDSRQNAHSSSIAPQDQAVSSFPPLTSCSEPTPVGRGSTAVDIHSDSLHFPQPNSSLFNDADAEWRDTASLRMMDGDDFGDSKFELTDDDEEPAQFEMDVEGMSSPTPPPRSSTQRIEKVHEIESRQDSSPWRMSSSSSVSGSFGFSTSPARYDLLARYKPPLAPAQLASPGMDDLIISEDSRQIVSDPIPNPLSAQSSTSSTGRMSGLQRGISDNAGPPSFHDSVKRSTRFVTAVPAADVLEFVESLLEDCRLAKTSTPLGVIGKVVLHLELYRLEVWGVDDMGPSLCALQLYQMFDHSGPTYASSPSRMLHDGIAGVVPSSQNQYMVEFVRGQVDIFVFKRFYQWVRLLLSELVKRDYSLKLFDQAASPMVDNSFLKAQFKDIPH